MSHIGIYAAICIWSHMHVLNIYTSTKPATPDVHNTYMILYHNTYTLYRQQMYSFNQIFFLTFCNRNVKILFCVSFQWILINFNKLKRVTKLSQNNWIKYRISRYVLRHYNIYCYMHFYLFHINHNFNRKVYC